MKSVSELSAILSQQLAWHKARIDCFCQMLLALFMVRSINLSEIAVAMNGQKASIDSRYKRVIRFFSIFDWDLTVMSRFIYSLFFTPQSKVYLAIDRTNWFWGKAPINVLMLSVCYEGIAIPLFWSVLPKTGSTTAKEQITLIKRFIQTFGKANIEKILGDREFPNQELIAWLTKQQISFCFRIKSNTTVKLHAKKYKSAAGLFAHLKPYQHQVFPMKVQVFGQWLYLASSLNTRSELLIVVTDNNPKTAVACYLRRWEIETLFAALKTKGFRFEDTRITQPKRIEKLISLLALGLAWAHKVGEWKASLKPIRLTTIRRQRRPKQSFFRLGLDSIRDMLTNPFPSKKRFLSFLKCLLIPQPRTIF